MSIPKRILKTNIMCVKVKLVVPMNKHSNVYWKSKGHLMPQTWKIGFIQWIFTHFGIKAFIFSIFTGCRSPNNLRYRKSYFTRHFCDVTQQLRWRHTYFISRRFTLSPHPICRINLPGWCSYLSRSFWKLEVSGKA